ncbi:uncharacterized protein LOC143117337 [Alosa pseudoharengus]|uniref:uncharacterized protein LOC143117337 n=1 Tax=Alosa pseudoharengus TaxID=34774 RepID=UPI003F8B2684
MAEPITKIIPLTLLVYKQLQKAKRNKKGFQKLATHVKDVADLVETVANQGVEEGVVKTGLEMFERALESAMKLQRDYGRSKFYLRCIRAQGFDSSLESVNKQLNEAKHSLTLAFLVEQRQKQTTDEQSISPDQFVKLINCLCEMKDQLQQNELQRFLEKQTETELSSDNCSDLADVLLKSDEVLDEFDIDKYNTTDGGRQRLVPVVKCCRKARLTNCNLNEEFSEVVASALQSPYLRELHLDGTIMSESGLKAFCGSLTNRNCVLEILSLRKCSLSSSHCEDLASILCSSASSLKELDL